MRTSSLSLILRRRLEPDGDDRMAGPAQESGAEEGRGKPELQGYEDDGFVVADGRGESEED